MMVILCARVGRRLQLGVFQARLLTNTVDDLDHPGVNDAVEHLVSAASGPQDGLGFQEGQLLGGVGLLGSQVIADFVTDFSPSSRKSMICRRTGWATVLRTSAAFSR
jgi:hypothetical protein